MIELSGSEAIELQRLKGAGGQMRSYSDPAQNCAAFSRLWDAGFVDDCGTSQILLPAGREALAAFLAKAPAANAPGKEEEK